MVTHTPTDINKWTRVQTINDKYCEIFKKDSKTRTSKRFQRTVFSTNWSITSINLPAGGVKLTPYSTDLKKFIALFHMTEIVMSCYKDKEKNPSNKSLPDTHQHQSCF